MSTDNDTLADFIFKELTTQEGWTAARNGNSLNLKSIHHVRTHLPMLLKLYNGELDRSNPALFRYMNDSSRAALQSKLRFSWLLLYAQHQLDCAEGRRYLLDELTQKMTQCENLLDELHLSASDISPEIQLEKAAISDKPLKYLGLTTVAPFVVNNIMAFIGGEVKSFSEHKTGTITGAMSAVNGTRLYWVWGGGLLSSVLDILPDDFYNKIDAAKGVSAPAPYTGYMSWILYYARGGIGLGLLLKHWIWPAIVDSEESQIPAGERFITQWNQRKFSLLNDCIWATSNMACFFWLRGPGTLGYMGNILTAGLLLMDVTLTAWRFMEEVTAHNKNISELQQTKEKLQSALEEKRHDPGSKEEISLLNSQIKDLDKLIKKTEFDWKYQRYNTINDLVYAIGLLVAFGLVCCFFYPPALIPVATQMIYAVAGAALCFVFTVVQPAVAGGIEISKTSATGAEARKEAERLLERFKTEPNDNIKKMLYLEMQALLVDSSFQQQIARFQIVKLLRSVFIDALIPAIIFAALVFMPLNIGLGILAAGLALAALSKIIIDQFEPTPDKLPLDDQDFVLEYNEFIDKPVQNLSHFDKGSTKSLVFFEKSKPEDQKNLVKGGDDPEYKL